MKKSEVYLPSNDGKNQLHTVIWEPDTEYPRAILQIVHGMCEYVDRYDDFANYLTQNGFAVIMGTGFIPDSAAKIGMMLSSLICKTKGERYKSKLLESLTLGSNNKAFAPNRTPDDWLTRDEKAVDKYVNDKLCGFTFTAKAYNDFFKIIHSIAINKKCEGISKELPVLITSGEVDPVGGKKACEKLLFKYESAKITDTSIRIYPNDRHEILNELDKEEVYKDIADWLISKI